MTEIYSSRPEPTFVWTSIKQLKPKFRFKVFRWRPFMTFVTPKYWKLYWSGILWLLLMETKNNRVKWSIAVAEIATFDFQVTAQWFYFLFVKSAQTSYLSIAKYFSAIQPQQLCSAWRHSRYLPKKKKKKSTFMLKHKLTWHFRLQFRGGSSNEIKGNHLCVYIKMLHRCPVKSIWTWDMAVLIIEKLFHQLSKWQSTRPKLQIDWQQTIFFFFYKILSFGNCIWKKLKFDEAIRRKSMRKNYWETCSK